MTHQVGTAQFYAAIALVLLTGFLAAFFSYKRKQSAVRALDWLIAVFSSVALMGIAQILKVLYHDKSNLFVDELAPRSLDIVTLLNLVVLLILYLMGESFLGDRIHTFRLVVLVSLITSFFSVGFYYSSVGVVPKTSDFVPFARDTLIDSFFFDLIQIYVISLILYVFFLQYKITSVPKIRRVLLLLLASIIIFLISSIIEFLEHFIPIAWSAFITALPTFLILAGFYIAFPNFVYLTPTNISFLQIIAADGTLLYAAELTEDIKDIDFLVGPSLVSVGSIISELVQLDEPVKLKQFMYEGGYILFEEIEGIKAIVQTDRPSFMLKRSMRYFLREFNKHFADQIKNYTGSIHSQDGVSPDFLFAYCIPIIQSKAMISNIS